MAKYKGDKGIKEEVAGSYQLENIINNIKSQMHSTNPAQLARLNSAISSLLASDLPAKILKILEFLQAVVAKEKQRKEQRAEFNKDADTYLTARKNRIDQLHDVVKYLNDGKDVESKLQKLVKSEDQIKQQHEEHKKLLEYRDKIHEHYDGVMKHDEKLRSEKVRLEKEAEKEKQKPKKIHSPSVFEEVTQEMKEQDKKITNFAPVVEQAQKQRDEVDAKIQEIEKRKDVEEEIDDLDKLVKQLQQTDPAKHNKLSKFTTLLKNQEEAVTGNDIVNDTSLRSEFTDKIKNAENLEPEIAGTNIPSSPSKLTEVANDKTPQDSKTIDQEQDKTPTTNLNKTLKNESHKLRDRIIQKLGYDEHRWH